VFAVRGRNARLTNAPPRFSQPTLPVRNHEDYLRIPHERIRNFAIIAHGETAAARCHVLCQRLRIVHTSG
jgi:hypothetical protein